MIPYAGFLYFAVLLYLAVPTVLLRLANRGLRLWILAATAIMLVVQYSDRQRLWFGKHVTAFWIVAGCAAFEWIVAWMFLQSRLPAMDEEARTGVKRKPDDLRTPAASVAPFALAIALALLPLLWIRIEPLLRIREPVTFLGVSYLTFRCLDVIMLVQDRVIARLPIAEYFAYVLFFPTISSGPIDRFRRFDRDWRASERRESLVKDLDQAVRHTMRGFLYKFIIAALIKRQWMDPAGRREGLSHVLSYMYAYSGYLFFDFAGYSAFAIGASYLFGIHTPENFNRPFLASNIRDFWNRWHISLSEWFRDHVYMRFVLASARGRWFRNRYAASAVAFFLAFGLMGLWHGGEAHFILYGLYHASLLVGYESFTRWNRTRRIWGDGPLWRLAGIALTFNAVCFGFLLFSGRIGP